MSGDECPYLGWQRWKESGDTTMDFELNQSDQGYNVGQGVPVRTAGDLLFTYDLSSQGTVVIPYRDWIDNPAAAGDEKWGAGGGSDAAVTGRSSERTGGGPGDRNGGSNSEHP